MLSRPIHVLVGSLVLALLVLVSGVGIWVNFHPRSRATAPYVLVAHGDVIGIRPGSPVFLRGVLVGGVRSVRFVPGYPRLIRVRITVLPGTPIFQGAYAEISAPDVTSDLSAIDLYSDNTKSRRLTSAAGQPAFIPIRPPAPDSIQAQARQAIQDARLAATRAQHVMGEENRVRLDRLQQNLHMMTAQAETMQRQWRSTARNLPALGNEVRQTVAQAQRMQANAKAAAELLGQHTRGLGKTVSGITQQLKADRRMLQMQWQENLTPGYDGAAQSATTALEGAQALSQDLRANPQSLLLGNPAAGPDPGEPGFNPGEQTTLTENPAQP